MARRRPPGARATKLQARIANYSFIPQPTILDPQPSPESDIDTPIAALKAKLAGSGKAAPASSPNAPRRERRTKDHKQSVGKEIDSALTDAVALAKVETVRVRCGRQTHAFYTAVPPI
jgi:hypothetical protein